MFRLVYSSRSHEDMSPAAMTAIVRHARQRNTAAGITGLLLYHQRQFLQVIEGERSVVEACFDRIKGDVRHEQIVVLSQCDAASKFFTNWFLAYEALDHLPLLTKDHIISLQQLHNRLEDLRGVETSRGRKDVMRRLRAYLWTEARYRTHLT